VKHLCLEMARLALNKVREIQQLDESKRKEYLTLARKLGSMIIQNGLIGTVIFLKKKDSVILTHLEDMVRQQTQVNISEPMQILDKDYFRIQIVALEVSKWLKRYAEILLGGD